MDTKMVYNLEGKDYEVVITYKRIRNIHFRFENGAFRVSCSRITPKKMIISGLDKYAKKLINRSVKEQAFGEDYFYLFGKKIEVSYPGQLQYDAETTLCYKSQEDLLKKLRKLFLNYMTSRTLLFADRMNCPRYFVKVRQMKSRYGSNNRHSKTITYSLTLLHYSPEIIDSVIVHELAHCHVYNHSDSFYRVVYKYCPEYDVLRKKLIKAVFA